MTFKDSKLPINLYVIFRNQTEVHPCVLESIESVDIENDTCVALIKGLYSESIRRTLTYSQLDSDCMSNGMEDYFLDEEKAKKFVSITQGRFPLPFVKTYVEKITDEETGEVRQIERHDIDCTVNDPNLIPMILRYMSAILKRVSGDDEWWPLETPIEDYKIEIFFTRDRDSTKSKVEGQSNSEHLYQIRVTNE